MLSTAKLLTKQQAEGLPSDYSSRIPEVQKLACAECRENALFMSLANAGAGCND